MRIGMTFDLKTDYLARGYTPDQVAELDSEITVAAIEGAIRDMGHAPDRIGGITELVSRLAKGERWDLVFNIAEGMHGLGREAQVPGVLDAFNIPYTFSGPDLLALTLHKGFTNAVVRTHGVPTADFHVVRTAREIDEVNIPFPLFAKPVAEGTSKGISARSVIRSRDELHEVCRELLLTHRQPVLVESFLPGREFTVGILGSGDAAEVIGVLEVSAVQGGDTAAYTYDNKQEWQERVVYEVARDAAAEEAGALALRAWKGLGCLDGGRVDVRQDVDGKARFIEVNPLAGLNPESSDLPILCGKIGLPYETLIQKIVESALKRTKCAPTHSSEAA